MKVAIKLLVSALLVYFVFSQIDIQRLINSIKSINIFYYLLAFVLYNISKIVSAIRLNFYFKEIGINLPLIQNLKLYYVGMFYNLFLPGGIGGDGYKAYLLKKHYKKKLAPILKALLFDRVSGLVALIFLASVLFIFSSYSISPLKELNYIVLLTIYPIFYFVSKRYNIFFYYFKKTNLLGLAVQFLQLLSAVALIFALPQELPIIELLVLFLISSIVSVLPITIGGVGVRELTFLYGLKFIGWNPDIGIAFSFLFFSITLLASLIGVLFLHKPMNIETINSNL